MEKKLANITGTAISETKIGTTDADVIKGLGGDDILKGGAGNDVIYGGIGNDKLYGEAGSDTLYGEDGNDYLDGGTGIAKLFGGAGNDTLIYNPTSSAIPSFNDYFLPTTLDGGTGYDTLTITNNATMDGLASRTTILGLDNGRSEIIFGGPRDGDDYKTVGTFGGIEELRLSGNGGADYFADTYINGPKVVGTAKADSFFGGFGNNDFNGGAGNDTLYVSGGNDKLNGGTGADGFVVDYTADGKTTISGFEGAGVVGGDKFHFERYILNDPAKQMTYVGGNTVFDLEGDMSIVVLGVKVGMGDIAFLG